LKLTVPGGGMFCKRTCNPAPNISDAACCDVVNLTDAKMHAAAVSEDVSKMDGDGGRDVVVIRVKSDQQGFSPARLMHSVERLIVRLANMFSLYPSNTTVPLGSSLLTRDDPTFGVHVQDERKDKLTFTWIETQAWVIAALKMLPDRPDLVTKWFGNGSNASDVRGVLIGAMDTLSQSHIMRGTEEYCVEGVVAYVITYVDSETDKFLSGQADENGNDIIHVCERYWTPELFSSPSWRFGAMVHEAVHHQGMGDEPYQGKSPYGHDNCLALAQNEPSLAMKNADNYRWFVYELVANNNTAQAAPANGSESAAGVFGWWDLVKTWVDDNVLKKISAR
jgi:hypothetical protein